jgi:hypothetical protein
MEESAIKLVEVLEVVLGLRILGEEEEEDIVEEEVLTVLLILEEEEDQKIMDQTRLIHSMTMIVIRRPMVQW